LFVIGSEFKASGKLTPGLAGTSIFIATVLAPVHLQVVGESGFGWTRQRLGLRQPSAAFHRYQSARGLAQSKTLPRTPRR
jgi:hypothetical protein